MFNTLTRKKHFGIFLNTYYSNFAISTNTIQNIDCKAKTICLMSIYISHK